MIRKLKEKLLKLEAELFKFSAKKSFLIHPNILSYMYAKVEKGRYQQVTGNARAAILSGRFIASVIAQLLVSFELMNLRDLNFLTLGGESQSKSFVCYVS